MPRREVYQDLENEIQEEFAHHHVERDMADAYRETMRPISAEEMRAKKYGVFFNLAALLVVVTGLLFMFAAAFGLI
ncbi:hypothetical protein OIU34_11910 [Pararhizobium sp. BT-229]|uniref:hypothetical protein n=1 Tax=Pararhizobium sp. BT-229 TaxID=2986923 RepID=UPI0021F73C72|nr:hypothetical protein [Pararhizobium sp. BT-229]MCV9962604.1 hypothetical protein [Pararhizobium sp. BT-229]